MSENSQITVTEIIKTKTLNQRTDVVSYMITILQILITVLKYMMSKHKIFISTTQSTCKCNNNNNNNNITPQIYCSFLYNSHKNQFYKAAIQVCLYKKKVFNHTNLPLYYT